MDNAPTGTSVECLVGQAEWDLDIDREWLFKTFTLVPRSQGHRCRAGILFVQPEFTDRLGCLRWWFQDGCRDVMVPRKLAPRTRGEVVFLLHKLMQTS